MTALATALGTRPAAFLLDERIALDIGSLITYVGICGDAAPRRALVHRPVLDASPGPATHVHGAVSPPWHA